MPEACPSFVDYLGLSLRSKVICLFPDYRQYIGFPPFQWTIFEQEVEDVALRAFGELLLLRPLVLQLLPLLVEELLGVDELRHVLAVRLEPAHLDGRLLRLGGPALGGEVRRVLVDQVLQREG